MKRYGAAVSIRGDNLYCPLPLSIDSYFNCLVDCHSCYSRRLNRVWGQDLRPADPEVVAKKLRNGLKNKNPKTDLAWALRNKKTLRLGNRTDPYQPAEMKMGVTRRIIEILIELEWTFIIQTRFTNNLIRDEDLIEKADQKGLITLLPIISPGLEKDWEVLERKRTPEIGKRILHIGNWIQKGFKVGVGGEPFIPGFHTTKNFKRTVLLLLKIGVQSYNTYNLHLNDHVAKRLCEIGLDIEKIWRMNQDKYWGPIQKELCQIALDVGIRLGCPDFVNTGPEWREKANTCCGIHIPNPCRFNTHYWKRTMQLNPKTNPQRILESTYEGIGDMKKAEQIVHGRKCDMYTMKDAGLI